MISLAEVHHNSPNKVAIQGFPSKGAAQNGWFLAENPDIWTTYEILGAPVTAFQEPSPCSERDKLG